MFSTTGESLQTLSDVSMERDLPEATTFMFIMCARLVLKRMDQENQLRGCATLRVTMSVSRSSQALQQPVIAFFSVWPLHPCPGEREDPGS